MTNHLKKLIQQQETRIKRLKTEYQGKLSRNKKQNDAALKTIRAEYEQKIQALSQALQYQTEELKHEIAFHKEMNDAQRIMLQDALLQCQKLEDELTKLND
ncbi:MAG TPA: hypothetical protein DCS93_33560 [Microscillaceae bacterium]|nr:hypothetical protein [Microscillaceae bacterium]